MSETSSLKEKLIAQILATGPIGVDEFMQACLIDLDDGYYMKKDPFGQVGDFTTSPEISQVFGEMLGGWFAYVAQHCGQNKQIHLIEMGPGRGTLMSDMLRVFQMCPDLCRFLHLHLVEISSARQQQQQIKLMPQSYIPAQLTWYQTLAECYQQLQDQLQAEQESICLFVANELLDALPIQQWRLTSDGWQLRSVTSHEGVLHWCWGPAQQACPSLLADQSYPFVSEADIYEICPGMVDIVTGVADILTVIPGTALFIDYGYDQSQPGESLQALKGHHYHRVLDIPGQADVTSHVDFAAVRRVAKNNGLHSCPLLSQGQFLVSLGINFRLQKLATVQPETAGQILQAGQRLYHPEAMGDLFKVQSLSTIGFPIFPPFSP